MRNWWFLALMMSSGLVGAREPTGFKELKLGASFESVAAGRDAYLNCEPPDSAGARMCLIRAYPNPNLSYPRDQLTTVGGISVDIGLDFRSGKLTAIYLMFPTDRYDLMHAGAIDKYGKPKASGADPRTNGTVSYQSRWSSWLTADAYIRIDEQRNKVGQATFSIMSRAMLEDAQRRTPSAKDF